ncbi:MAG TPA: glycosyltransferase family 4 protein [Gemmatimonadales bacterium]|nr:glycosyltransferase family 4 protein [Gemmatimonadales bacterium]
MKIVYVTQRLPFGTGETFVVPEVEALLTAGHEILIVPRLSREEVVHDNVDALLRRTRALPGAAAVLGAVLHALARAPRATIGAFWRLRRTRPRRRTYSNAIATAQGLWLAREARRWGADHIHAHWAHLTATLAMSASALSGIPWSFTAHRYDVLLNNLLTEKLRSARFGRFIAREMLETARPMLAPDAAARAVVVHMGVELPPAPAPGAVERTTPILLCPARLVPVKGHGYLLEAAARLVRRGVAFQLWLAGDGPERASVERRIAELGLSDRLRLLDTVPHSELLMMYREHSVDCVVLPSLHEGLSVALIEAMAHGVPVVATAVGGVPELLKGDAGVLVPPRDPEALADALASVLESPERRAQLARAGRLRVATEFDVQAIARELAERFTGNGQVERVG